MALYIHGFSNISPQRTWENSMLPSDVIKPEGNRFFAIEPDHSKFIDAKHLRRMSRIIKMGVTAGVNALKEAHLTEPDAIITGTGYGCLDDTGTFLAKMIDNKEQALNPTPFIQSTHNTIGSQIALLLQCQGYNQTYAQGSLSFENVILDALMHSAENPTLNMLIGGIDEITNVSHTILERFNIFSDYPNGEGSAFFVASGSKKEAKVCVENVATFFNPTVNDLKEGLKAFGTGFDLVLSGSHDQMEFASLFDYQNDFVRQDTAVIPFKHFSGEYPTASAFAVAMAASILLHGLPASWQSLKKDFNRILIANESYQKCYSIISVVRC